MYEYRVKVLKVVDGDTLHLEVDLGLETFRKITVRLAGINAPEMGTPEGESAKAYVEGWTIPWVKDVSYMAKTTKDKREKYGRYLAELYLIDSRGEPIGPSLNDCLVQGGFAERKTY